MFIKLAIIVGIVILGGLIFLNEITTFFPTTATTVIDSLKNDVSNIGSNASDSVENRIGESVDKVTGSVTNEINKIKDSSEKLISDKVTNFNPIESIQNIFSGD